MNQKQSTYEKKNWSSVTLFNTAKSKALTPDYVNSASGLDLHRFNWLENVSFIGDLPHRWNHLVDYDPPRPTSEISNLHFTTGGPYYEDYKKCGFAELWFEERNRMLHAGPIKA